MFNFFRTPLTKPVEFKNMKSVALYQVPVDDSVGRMMNLIGKYIPVSEMECVFSTRLSGDVEDILNECFEVFNEADSKCFILNYSMSVGDVVSVDGHMYRCLPRGWKEIGCDMDGETIPLGDGDYDAPR